MCLHKHKYIFLLIVLLCMLQCRKPYVPAVLVKGDNYLVVDGFINTSPAGVTSILLSRTKNLTDTVVTIPENGAQLTVQSASGVSYQLSQQSNNGLYTSAPLQLNNNEKYNLLIKTANGKQYTSDLVSIKKTPAIDSVSWRQDTAGVHVFANTHDVSGNTRFYRWQYVETWEYDSELETPWGLNGNTIYVRDPLTGLVHVCYTTTNSTGILLGNSASLSQDIISMAPLFTIPPNDTMLAQRMSIQLLQYALTPQAYFYWQVIQKNSQQLGTLFDLQPSQLEGNIHAVDNPTEPVVGFLSAGTMEEKRIFISKYDLIDWHPPLGSYDCLTKIIGQDPTDFSKWTYPDPSYAPWYFATGAIIIAKKTCLDCRESGGTVVKPVFW